MDPALHTKLIEKGLLTSSDFYYSMRHIYFTSGLFDPIKSRQEINSIGKYIHRQQMTKGHGNDTKTTFRLRSYFNYRIFIRGKLD